MAKKPAPTVASKPAAEPVEEHAAQLGDFRLVDVVDGNPQYVNPLHVTAVEARGGNVGSTIHLAGGTAVHTNKPPAEVYEALFA